MLYLKYRTVKKFPFLALNDFERKKREKESKIGLDCVWHGMALLLYSLQNREKDGRQDNIENSIFPQENYHQETLERTRHKVHKRNYFVLLRKGIKKITIHKSSFFDSITKPSFF